MDFLNPFCRHSARLCLILFFGLSAFAAQAENLLERQVKAAYLYRFAGFVEWPEGVFPRPDSPLVIGVAGNDALADQLEQTVAGRTSSGHTLAVRRIKRGDSLAGIHVLFVGGNDRAALAELLKAASGLPILTVSDNDEAAALGVMVNLVLVEEKLRFEVALRPVNTSRIRISARMLSAAHKVQQGGSS